MPDPEPSDLSRENALLKRRLAELESEVERFRTTLYSIGDAVIVTDAEGRVLRMNRVAEQLTGWCELDAVGLPSEQVFRIVNEESGKTVESPVAHVRREGCVVGLANHTLLLARDGREFPIADSGAPILNASGDITGVVLVFRDQSAERAAQKALQQSEAFNRTIVANIPQRLFLKDRHSTYIAVNAAYADSLGHSPDAFIGRDDFAFHPAALARKYREDDQAVMDSGQIKDLEEAYVSPQGTAWIRTIKAPVRNEAGDVTAVLGLFEDISARKRADDELRIKNHVFEDSIAAQSISDTNGVLTHVNRAFLRLWGFATKEDVVGKTVADLFANPAEARAVFECMNGGNSWEGEFNAVRRDGSVFVSRGYATSLHHPDGTRLGFQSTNLDVTELREAERQLKDLNINLARSNKELEQFAYVASHDLQEPLRMVASFTQLLSKRYKGRLDADADDFIRYAVQGANRMQTLINDLLTFSRVNTRGKPPTATACDEILGEACANLQAALAESNAEITHDPLPTLMVDSSQLLQVFQNLLGNALKFRGERPCHIHVSAEKLENQWCLSVRDNGIGIAPEYFDRIFIIFQRLHGKDEYQGTGIGLAICKRVVERHGGRIWVESTPGEGSVFHFTLPDA